VAINFEDVQKQLVGIQGAATDAKLKTSLQSITQDIRTFAQEKEDERNRLQTASNQLQTTIAQLQSTVSTLQQNNAEQLKKIDELKKKAEGASPAATATPLSLVSSFKSVIDTIQTQARQTPGVATTIKSMDLEVKGLVQLQPGTNNPVLIMPAQTSLIDPAALSTMRVSFGAVPVAAPEAISTPATPSPSKGSVATGPVVRASATPKRSKRKKRKAPRGAK
jgi:predicted RNase H-like nuclease (RuvC/YqgF family)